ncbi:MAG: EF-P 5-aminopentanol modification-associated protein YfmF [Acutalibacter sp.]
MSEMISQRLSDSVTLHTFTDPRFKTMKISVNLFVPLKRETAARNAILPALVSYATREYPDYTALNCRLAQLYGAALASGVQKVGGFQVLNLSVSGLANRYAFGGEDMFSQLSGLLFDVMFDPLREENGLFSEEGFRQKQRALLETLDAEYNDKITYAHRRCEELLFQGQSAELCSFGTKEEIAALDRRAVTQAWEEILHSAQFEIFVLGDCVPHEEIFAKRFAGLGKPQPVGLLEYKEPKEVRRVTEEQPLSQSKLSMGFRADLAPEEKLLFRLTTAVLGGVPSSKLFQNVREKMGLCYYCSSSMASNSRAMFIESGVETDNLQRAEEAILEQLNALQRGEVTEEELLSAKLALKNSLRSARDSLTAMESAYLGQVFSGHVLSPEESAEKLMTYTGEQVAEAARRLRLAAVYTLKGGAVHG